MKPAAPPTANQGSQPTTGTTEAPSPVRAGQFANRPGVSALKGVRDLWAWRSNARKLGLPKPPLVMPPVVAPDLEAIHRHGSAPDSVPLVTWIGHSSCLVQSDGLSVLTDPIFSERCSPTRHIGPRRHTPPALVAGDLPRIDAVVISHDHYDHLDEASCIALRDSPAGCPLFVVPKGLGRWFARRRMPFVELDWWDRTGIGAGSHATEITLAPAQHWSGRGLNDRLSSLWGAPCVLFPGLKVYYAGDTGMGNHFREAGERLAKEGGIDLALIPIGAYEPRWFMRNQHIDPFEAVQAHLDLQARRSLAIHWGTFTLTDESLDEPPRQLEAARIRYGVAEARFPHVPIGTTLALR